MGTVYSIDPTQDPRWAEFVSRNEQSSIFHTREWLLALRHTYRYDPIVFTTTSPAELQIANGIVFCQVSSWLTGRRLVSLPFSDHCQPLVSGAADLAVVLKSLEGCRKWKYVELRPATDDMLRALRTTFNKSESFQFHKIDLRPTLHAIYQTLHDSCIRRKIKKAEREGLAYEVGRSDLLLAKFHHLLLLTRRRHQLPPQPLGWFRNLVGFLASGLTIRVVSYGAVPIASMITLLHKNTLTYKYGCSDARFHNLGAMPWLFWRAIQESKELGATEFDLGRSDPADAGLLAFKGHLGAVRSELNYYRSPGVPVRSAAGSGAALLRQTYARMPDLVFAGMGRLVYRHLG